MLPVPGVLNAFGMCVLSTDSSLLPDWKSGASDVLAYRDEGRESTFVLELVLESWLFFNHLNYMRCGLAALAGWTIGAGLPK